MTAGQVDIDMIYDALPEQFERNISATIEKLQSMNVNTVFLQTLLTKMVMATLMKYIFIRIK